MSKRNCVMGLLVCMLLAACGGAAPQSDAESGPQVWIDAPLPGDTLMLEPYTLVAHASSPAGIQSFEFSMDGELLAAPESDSGDNLSYAEYTWDPPGPGSYILEVRARDGTGSIGPMASTHFTVVEAAATATTTEEPVTATPTAAAASLLDPSFSESELFYRGSCGPKEVDIRVSALDPQIHSVVLFYRLRDAEGAATTDWVSKAMNPAGEDFVRTLHVEADVPEFASFPTSILQVQLVATDAGGEELARSEVISEVQVMRCSR